MADRSNEDPKMKALQIIRDMGATLQDIDGRKGAVLTLFYAHSFPCSLNLVFLDPDGGNTALVGGIRRQCGGHKHGQAGLNLP